MKPFPWIYHCRFFFFTPDSFCNAQRSESWAALQRLQNTVTTFRSIPIGTTHRHGQQGFRRTFATRVLEHPVLANSDFSSSSISSVCKHWSLSNVKPTIAGPESQGDSLSPSDVSASSEFLDAGALWRVKHIMKLIISLSTPVCEKHKPYYLQKFTAISMKCLCWPRFRTGRTGRIIPWTPNFHTWLIRVPSLKGRHDDVKAWVVQ